MKTVELGEYVNAILHNSEGEYKNTSGKVCAILSDPHGRRIVQIKKADGKAVNVDLFAVNATSEERRRYIDVMDQAREIQESGNKEVEEVQKAIVEACNEQINDLYASLMPLVDLNMPDDLSLPDEEETEH